MIYSWWLLYVIPLPNHSFIKNKPLSSLLDIRARAPINKISKNRFWILEIERFCVNRNDKQKEIPIIQMGCNIDLKFANWWKFNLEKLNNNREPKITLTILPIPINS